MNKWLQSSRGASEVLKGLIGSFATFFVGYTFEEDGKLRKEYVNFSGFLCHHKKYPPCWITAGHVFDEFKKIKESAKIRTLGFSDTPMLPMSSDYNGFPITEDDFIPIHLDKDGFDIGIMIFKPRVWKLLISNKNNLFIKTSQWKTKAKTSGYFLIGAPQELHRPVRIESKTRFSLRLFAKVECLPLKKINDKKLDAPAGFWKRKGAFYALIEPYSDGAKQPDHIGFMSGGPIYRVKYRARTKTIQAMLIGIQSAWDAPTRIIRATHARFLERVMDVVYKEIMKTKRTAKK